MPVPDGPQFNIEHPFPRLRNAYAKSWSKSYGDMLRAEGEDISSEDLQEAGNEQANAMVEMALYPDEGRNYARKLLYNKGFLNRHNR